MNNRRSTDEPPEPLDDYERLLLRPLLLGREAKDDAFYRGWEVYFADEPIEGTDGAHEFSGEYAVRPGPRMVAYKVPADLVESLCSLEVDAAGRIDRDAARHFLAHFGPLTPGSLYPSELELTMGRAAGEQFTFGPTREIEVRVPRPLVERPSVSRWPSGERPGEQYVRREKVNSYDRMLSEPVSLLRRVLEQAGEGRRLIREGKIEEGSERLVEAGGQAFALLREAPPGSLLDALVRQALVRVLAGAGSRRCRQCGRFFSPRRQDTIYCSKRCTDATAARAYRRRKAGKVRREGGNDDGE